MRMTHHESLEVKGHDTHLMVYGVLGLIYPIYKHNYPSPLKAQRCRDTADGLGFLSIRHQNKNSPSDWAVFVGGHDILAVILSIKLDQTSGGFIHGVHDLP